MNEAADRLNEVRAMMKDIFVARDAEIDGLSLALVAGTNMLLLGPPGTAKSMLSTTFGSAIGCGRIYERLLGAFSVPDEVFGPFNPQRLLEGVYERNVEGYLPDAEFAYLDEIFNAQQELLTTMNTVLNEKKFDQGTQRIKCPLQMAVGAANVYPEGDLAMAALYDRFLIRFWTPYTSSREEKMALLKLAVHGNNVSEARLQPGDIDALHQLRDQVTVSDSIMELQCDIEEALRTAGFVISDRRSMAQIKLLRASAVLAGRDHVIPSDMFVLADSLWDKHEDRPTVWKIIAQHIDQGMLRARALYDAVLVEFDKVDLKAKDNVHDVSRPASKARAALSARIKQARREIQNDPEIEDSEQVDKILNKLRALHGQVARAIRTLDIMVPVR